MIRTGFMAKRNARQNHARADAHRIIQQAHEFHHRATEDAENLRKTLCSPWFCGESKVGELDDLLWRCLFPNIVVISLDQFSF